MSNQAKKVALGAAIFLALLLASITAVLGQEQRSYTNEHPPFEVTYSAEWAIQYPPNGPDLYLEYQPVESANLIIAAAPLGVDRSILLQEIDDNTEALINQLGQQYPGFQLDQATTLAINNIPGLQFTGTAIAVDASGSEDIKLTATLLLGKQNLYFVTFQGTPRAYEHARESAGTLLRSFSATD